MNAIARQRGQQKERRRPKPPEGRHRTTCVVCLECDVLVAIVRNMGTQTTLITETSPSNAATVSMPVPTRQHQHRPAPEEALAVAKAASNCATLSQQPVC
eukprot:jgi/Ulvmu1/12075/UM083_0088.1